MSRTQKAWALCGVALIGLGVTTVSPIVGVTICAVVSFATSFVCFGMNVMSTCRAQSLVVITHAAALWLVSESLPLTLAMLAQGLSTIPSETAMVGLKKLFMLGPLVGGVLGVALLALAWPGAGHWVWWAVPHVLFFGLFIGSQLASVHKRAYLTMKRHTLRVGAPLPEIKLPRRDGSGEVDFADERGQALLILFVRGDWCPVCHVLMRVVNRERQTLLDKGVKLFTISPTEGELDSDLSDHLQLDSQLLFDQGAEVARRFGLLESDDPDAPSPLPIAVLVDAEGVIRDISSPQDVTAYSSDSRISRQLQLLPAAA